MSLGSLLKANASSAALVDLTINGEDWSDGTFETEEESVTIALTAKERSLLELPYDEEVQIIPLDENEQAYAYPEFEKADFEKEKLIEQFNQSDESETASEESQAYDSAILSVPENEQKGIFYLTMEKGEVQRFNVTWKSTSTKEVIVRSAEDNNFVQKLFQFRPAKQVLTPDVIPPLDAVSEESEEEESDAELASSGSSLTNPFGVEVEVSRTTGLAPFDEGHPSGYDDPGYDYGGDDNIVRTFDQVSYRINVGISNTNERYTSLRVRLDTELPDAWRIDKSGQVRQTAEIANDDPLIDTGNGTKKSSRSVWTKLDKASGQLFFTETIETFGGVHKDKLEPKFTVTIESATTTDEDEPEEIINQKIDGNVVPSMNDTVYISAKPLVDVNLAWTPNRMSNFESATGVSLPEKQHTMITNVGVYVQLKPLPGREDLTSIKGSTYPVGGIEYELEQRMIYTNEETHESRDLIIGEENPPLEVISYDGLFHTDMPNPIFTEEYQAYKDVYQFVSRQGLKAPVGYTQNTYPPNQEYSTRIGIYDTGTPEVKNSNKESNYNIQLRNLDYQPISVGRNKWFLSGDPMPSNAEPFSVTAMQVLFPYDYLETSGVEGNINYRLSISEIKYEGNTQEVEEALDMLWENKWPGRMRTFAAAVDVNRIGLSTNPINSKNYSSAGDSITARGNSIWGQFYGPYVDVEAETTTLYGRWNANSMVYDDSRTILDRSSGVEVQKTYYGVGLKVPDRTIRTDEDLDEDYEWYATSAEAMANGEISAVKVEYQVTDPAGSGSPRFFVPLRAVGEIGALDGDGNPNVLLTNVFNYASDGEILTSYYPTDRLLDYRPTTYKENGAIDTIHVPLSDWGDTLYISNMTIRPAITADKDTYTPDETINWTVDGSVESGYEDNLKVTFKVTIPKETQYIDGTAKDFHGNPLPDPAASQNDDGSWTLSWTLDYLANSNYNPRVTFDTSIISSQLDFDNNVADLNAKLVVEVRSESDESIYDNSRIEFRTATEQVTVTNSGVLVVDKIVDKPYIDNGKSELTYTVAYRNHSPFPMDDVRILDVLPYNGDGRGTKYSGNYSLTNAEQLNESIDGSIWYTKKTITVDTDPNTIDLTNGDWHKLGSNMSDLNDAKAVMLVYDRLPNGEDMSLSLTIETEEQTPGDILINSPSLNSSMNLYVNGVPRSVRVVGRDLSGVAWYDDSYDGLIGDKYDQTGPEDFAADIPVKLYKIIDKKPQLVEENSTGEKFIDGNGDSLIKTDADGRYTFTCLPEGKYVVEFIVDRQKYRATKKLVGEDATKNSKANQECKTTNYTLPLNNDCGPLWVLGDPQKSTHHTTDVNIGLIGPSAIKLFKYEAGTAIDEDEDGELSDSEKASGAPLEGAVFDLHEGHGGTGDKIGTATTDEKGNIQFTGLFPDDYSLVETKAPSKEYELLKKPINVTITRGNQVIQLYQDNERGTELPFTGGNNPILIVLLVSAGLLAIGFISMMAYYRQSKQRGKL
ncbi:SpaA isopeptide-forming pilin-related protein [Enterococcus sp. AZ109]|uniref:SpaA isopeptide-forming pilin-related protein n=1 Tax=Enterococcus sp. AZ109 TaxID=2774634 RepID=UPI003F683FC4